jgi:proline iminopeptidase
MCIEVHGRAGEPVAVREGHFAALDAELYVRQAGGRAGRPVLVAVHGGPGLSHELLEGVEVLASARLAVITYDQRGVGQSSGTVDPARVFDQSVEDLDAVRRFFGTERIHLLGHSWGGLVAALYAARHTENVASLILVDSIPATSVELAEATARQRRRLADFQARGLVPAELPDWEDDAEARLLAIWPIYFADPRHPGARTLGGARYSLRAASAANAALDRYDVSAEIAAVVAPTLHFIASAPFGSAMGEAMARATVKAPGRRVLLSAAGHLPFIEQPEAFGAEAARFVAENDARASAMDKACALAPKSDDGPFRRA